MSWDPSSNAIGSREQHRKSRTLVVITSTNVQFTTDPFDERPDNFHSQSLASEWIKSSGETGPSLETDSAYPLRDPFQSDRDLAFAVFGRVGDQFVDGKAQRNAGNGGQLDLNALDDDDPLRAIPREQHR